MMMATDMGFYAALAVAHGAPGLLAAGVFVSRFGVSGSMLLVSAAAVLGIIVVLRRADRRDVADSSDNVAGGIVGIATAVRVARTFAALELALPISRLPRQNGRSVATGRGAL